MNSSFLQVLDRWADLQPNKRAFVFLDNKGQEKEEITFLQLRESALKIAVALVVQKMQHKRVVLSFSPGLHFITAFFGCLYAGAVAVPLPPPKNKRQIARFLPILKDADPSLVLIEESLVSSLPFPNVRTLSDLMNFQVRRYPSLPSVKNDHIAFLQYTSGSTSLPKGVILTHNHLFSHQQVLQEAFQHDEHSQIVGWLPLYHDMGLIGNVFQSVYLGVTAVLMAPVSFLQRPFLWLQAISKYRATTSGGPNFAYLHCIAKINNADLVKLDLSSWKKAFNGAERIYKETMDAFTDRFSQVGFRRESFFSCYGLAEATLFVTGCSVIREVKYAGTNGQKLGAVCCGETFLGHKVRIVDPKTRIECPEETAGEVWIQGFSVASGYWKNQKATRAVFGAHTRSGDGPFMRSGDLGFIKDGGLYVLGRLKNMLVIRGRNFVPYDLESCVRQSHPLLTYTEGVALVEKTNDEDRLIILQELGRDIRNKDTIRELFRAITSNLTEIYEIKPYTVVFVKSNSLPRTTSGKLQHHRALEQYREGTLASCFSFPEDQICPSRTLSFTNGIVISDKPSFRDILSGILHIPSDEINSCTPLVQYGLDSITGMQFLAAIDAEWGKEVDLNLLLHGACLEEVEASVIEQTQAALSSRPLTKTVVESVKGSDYRLSWSQENVWTFLQIYPSSRAYNIFFGCRLTGSLSVSDFYRAITVLVHRHSALRTYFFRSSKVPMQSVCEEVTIPLVRHDLQHLSHEKQQEFVDQLVREESQYLFPLDQAPLFKIVLVEKSHEECLILFHFHHLICDGWSMQIFLQQLEQEYQNSLDGRQTSIDTEAHDYRAFVDWQQNLLSSETYSSIAHYWEEKLSSDTYSSLEISPFRGEIEGASGSQTVHLLPSLCEKLGVFTRENHYTLSVVLMTALHALLHLYTNEENIYLGYSFANRPNVDLHKTIGFFVNTLVNRTITDQTTSFLDLLIQVSKSIWTAPVNGSYPLHHLLSLLNPPRPPDTSPLFQAMFVMQNAPVNINHFASLSLELLDLPKMPSSYDLVLEVQHTTTRDKKKSVRDCGISVDKGDGGLDLIFEYRTNKISHEFAQELAVRYVRLLEEAMENPNRPIQELSLLFPEENEVLLYRDASISDRIAGKDTTFSSLIDIFETKVAEYPDKAAIISDTEIVTYRELLIMVNSVAQTLLEAEISMEEPVGICVSRDACFIAVVLGILKAGGAYVPIDPHFPHDRIHHMCITANIKILFVPDDHVSSFAWFEGIIMNPFSVVNRFDSFSLDCPAVPHKTLAYIMYTSGSTGQPKGVRVERKSLENFAIAAIELFSLSSDDKPLQFSALTWDTSSEEIYPTLLSGATLVLRSSSPVESFEELLSRTYRHGVTIWNLPSSYWHELVDGLCRREEKLPKSLRLVIVGGEKIYENRVREWITEYPDVKLLNTYGTTEATSISASFDLAQWQSYWKDVPIGHAIANVDLFLLNSSLLPVPPGMPGMLYIGGEGLARDYLHQDALTQQQFVIHPLTGKRLYRTGDIAYWTLSPGYTMQWLKNTGVLANFFTLTSYREPAMHFDRRCIPEDSKVSDDGDLDKHKFMLGEILLVGRRDRQVKRRGFRINLEEIEYALLELTEVDGCLLQHENVLIAYLVVDPMQPLPSITSVREFLRTKVPEYMIPDVFYFLYELPKLSNGKIDYLGLVQERMEPPQNVISSSTEICSSLEEKILSIWKSLLDGQSFSKNDNFFDVGGNSLLLIRLHEQLQEGFSITLNMSELFSHFTIAAQAQLVDNLLSRKSRLSPVAILEQLQKGVISEKTAKELLKAHEVVK